MRDAARDHDGSGLNDPARWEKMIAFYEEQAHPFTSLFAEDALSGIELGPASRLLDVGTGMGAAALAAAARGARVTAIDFAPGMVDRVRGYDLANVQALCMDGQALDLPDAAFDIGVSIFGVVLFPDWRAGLREMARVTRPGGIAIVATWSNPNGAGTNLLLWDVRRQLFPDAEQPRPISGLADLCDPVRFAEAMIEAGFTEPSIRAVTHDFQLKTSVIADQDRLIPFWADLPQKEKDAIQAEVKRRAEAARVSDHLPLPSTALIATARRP